MNALAKLTGLTQPTISILEAKQPNPKLDSLLRIARALDVNLGDVIKKACRCIENQASPEEQAPPTSSELTDSVASAGAEQTRLRSKKRPT